ncbi:MAG TPA: BON domain-containing protein [Phnomibacter sp.]|nr:BON domain-containing protein [Phnomibacter sp.]
MKLFTKSLLLLAVLGVGLASCKKKPKDEDLKAAIEKVVGSGISVSVTEGVATLSGEVADGQAKNAAYDAAKAVTGITSVKDNITIAAPPPPPVEIAVDSTLIKGAQAVVSKYKGVSASVADGVVTLTGSIQKKELAKLMQSLMALKPKSVDNKQLTIK